MCKFWKESWDEEREKREKNNNIRYNRSIAGDILFVGNIWTAKKREGMVEDNSVVLTCDMVDIERREERHSCISLCTSLSKECGITEIHSRKLLLGIVFFPVESYASDKRNL